MRMKFLILACVLLSTALAAPVENTHHRVKRQFPGMPPFGMGGMGFGGMGGMGGLGGMLTSGG